MASRSVTGALTELQTALDQARISEVTGTPRAIHRRARGAHHIELAHTTPDGSVASSIDVWVPPGVQWPPAAAAGSTVTVRGRWSVRRTTTPASIELTAISVTVHDTSPPAAPDTSPVIERQRSRTIPPVRTIGLICARSGVAGRTDFVGRLRQLAPQLRYDTRPAQLSGPGAVKAIVNSLRALDVDRTDLIVIVRGGGAATDLAVFDSRTLAAAIAATSTPVLVAVGHSTDRYLADDIAAYSAATPTSAAEIIGGWT
jgi:hypothetical protein